MIDEKEKIAQRLRAWGTKEYGGASNLARVLEITPQHLNPYWNGHSAIGPKMEQKLRNIGCPIEYLKTGDDKDYGYQSLRANKKEPLSTAVYPIQQSSSGGMVVSEKPSEYIGTPFSRGVATAIIEVKNNSKLKTVPNGVQIEYNKVKKPKENRPCLFIFKNSTTKIAMFSKSRLHNRIVYTLKNEEGKEAETYYKNEIRYVYEIERIYDPKKIME